MSTKKKLDFLGRPPHISRMDSAITLTITPSAYNRIEDIRTQRGSSRLNLRIAVDGGGCSGFRYNLSFDEQLSDKDILFDDCVAIDATSLPLLSGAVIDYTTGLMGENFKITNPNATSGCGCGESFAI